MTTKISIVGAAGTLGSCAAYAIATQGLADELVLLDVNENLLKCHVMDLETAVSGLYKMQIRTGTPRDMEGSDVVIVTAGAPWRFITSRMELLRDSLPIIRPIAEDIARYCPRAVVITATNPVDPLNYVIYRVTGMDRKRLLGYTLNDSFRFRMMAARWLGVAATDVEGWVAGEHGPHQVMLFSTLKVKGAPREINVEGRQRITEEIPKALHAYESLRTGRTTGWTSSVGLAAMVYAIVNDTGAVYPCSIILDGEFGVRDVSVSLPIFLGREGGRGLCPLELEPGEEQALEAAISYLWKTARSVDELLEES